MADTVDTATFSSPGNDAERPGDAAPADETEESQDARAVGDEDRAAPGEGEAEQPDHDRSVSELLRQLGGDLGELGMSAAQLEAARNMPEVRRAAREIAGALVMVVAALTAFAFLNVAAVEGLSRVVAPWIAALVLALVWIVVGGLLCFGVMGRARRWLLWVVVKAPPTEALEDLEKKRDDAGAAALSTLELLGPALATQVALAAVPKADEVAGDVAVGVVEVGDNVLDASEEIVGVVTEQVPGGGVVNQVWAVALTPGRFGIRVATTVLRRNRPTE